MQAIFKSIFLNEMLKFDYNFIAVCSQASLTINWTLVYVMAWCRLNDKPIPEPMFTALCDAIWHHSWHNELMITVFITAPALHHIREPSSSFSSSLSSHSDLTLKSERSHLQMSTAFIMMKKSSAVLINFTLQSYARPQISKNIAFISTRSVHLSKVWGECWAKSGNINIWRILHRFFYHRLFVVLYDSPQTSMKLSKLCQAQNYVAFWEQVWYSILTPW